jgi:translocation and assembly module TamB
VTLAVALMVVAALGLAVLATPAGSAWLIGAVAELAGDRLTVTGVRGTLLEGLAVDRLRLKAGRTTVVIEPAELAMSWPDLFRRRLRLVTARAGVVRIDIAPRPPDEPDSLVEPLLLPVAIVADPLEVARVEIRSGATAGAGEPVTPVVIGRVLLRGDLTAGDLNFSELRAEGYGVRLRARGRFGTGEPFPLATAVDWEYTAGPAGGDVVRGEGELSGDLSALRFEQVVRLPAPVGIGGFARLLGDQPEVVAEARWRNLDLTPGAAPDVALRSASGRLRVRGWIEGYTAGADAMLTAGARPAARLRVAAAGDAGQARFTDLRLDGFGGRVTGTGAVSWHEALAGEFSLQGTGLDLATIDPRVTGRLGFRSELRVAGSGDFSIAVPEAGGTLLGRPLRASGAVSRRAGLLTFTDVRLRAGPNRVELAGTWGEAIAGRFRVDAPDLATLWPGYAGALRGSGRVGGTAARPTLDLDLAGRDLATGDLRMASLDARGRLGAQQEIRLTVAAGGIGYAGRVLGDLELAVAGPVAAHRVELGLTGGEVGFVLRSAGSWRRGVLTGTIESAVVDVPGSEWSLRDPATFRVAPPELAVGAHCWDSVAAEACLADTRYGPRAFASGVDLRRFPLAALAAWLPADVGVTGTLDVAATAAGDPADLQRTLRGSLRGRLADTTVTWPVPDDEDVRTSISEFTLDAALADGALDFATVFAGGFGLRLAAEGQVTDALGAAPRIRAQITGGIPYLAATGPVLERLVDVGDVQGRIDVDVALSGDARQPDIAGGIQLDDGALTVPAAGIRVDRISLAATGREDGQLALRGNARSGKGYVAIDGTLAWRNRLVPAAEATVKGRVFDVISLPEGFVQVSPDVRVVLADGQFRVSGELLVPRAEIRLKKLEESPVRPSPDTVVHGRAVEATGKSPPLFVLDGLAVRLGERVSFEGFGLKTGLTGGLRLAQSLAADPTLVTGDGVVSLREGQFTAFGQKLEIERGSLIFAGVVTDPGLDVKASRDVDYEGKEVTVGVLLSGTLSRIQTRVFSEPAMGELDALSYLTTGKPLTAAGAGDRSLVATSAISLGLSQALPVVRQLGSALSVDEVAFGTTDTGDTAVVVGEQLGKNLFIRYSYGIFDKLGTVTATYKLGRRVSIEGSSGEEQALDLVYSVTW